MGVFQKLFGKYLLVTNTVSCGIMMGCGDLIQQRGEHWKRQTSLQLYDKENVSLKKRLTLTSLQNNETNTNFSLISNEHSKRNLQIASLDNKQNHFVNKEGTAYEHDYDRTKNMTIVGLFQGPFHHYFYMILDKCLPGKGAKTIVKKTFLDQLIASPSCLAIFFVGLGLLERREIMDISMEIKSKFFDTWKVDCCFWPPTQLLNFIFIPAQYRVLYINVMTMIYDIYLSYVKYDAEYD